MDQPIRIAGVPEHFNLPWHLAIEEGAFSDRGIELNWTDVPEGSGKMAGMLASGNVDLAVILTEGLVRSVASGIHAVIIQEYIASPLLWGIHVSASSPYKREADLKGRTAAISRFGSGSHLMAFVHARQQEWPLAGQIILCGKNLPPSRWSTRVCSDRLAYSLPPGLAL